MRAGRAAIAALVLLAAGCGDDGPTVSSGPAVLSDEPVAASAWTDEGMFLLRTDDRTNFASIVDPATGEEAAVAGPPFEFRLTAPEATAAGGEVLVGGIECEAFVAEEGEEHDVCVPGRRSVAAYDLEAGAWRTVDLPEEIAALERDGIVSSVGVTSDDRIAFWVGTGGLEAEDNAYWTYAPGSDQWSELPELGVTKEGSCLAGDQLVVVSAAEDPEGYAGPSLHVLDLADAGAGWAAGEPADVILALPPYVACGQTFAVVVGSLPYDPSDVNPTMPTVAYRHGLDDVAADGWGEIPGVPADHLPFRAIGAEDRVVVTGRGVALVIGPDGPAQSVEVPRVPYEPGVRPVWTGEDLLFVDFRTGEVTPVDLPA